MSRPGEGAADGAGTPTPSTTSGKRTTTTSGPARRVLDRRAQAWVTGAVVLASAMGGAAALPASSAGAATARPASLGSAPGVATAEADQALAEEAVAAVRLVHAGDVRGNLTLPATGLHGTTFTWSSARPAVVTSTGEVTRPAPGQPAVDVVLTVTGTNGTGTATRQVPVRVQPMPAPAEPEAYAFAYFAGESNADDEKIYLAASDGNRPLDYDQLNNGRPVLASELGEKGLRDPFLIRSHEGDRFYLLATDLKIFGGNNFGEAQESGSRSLMVWESTDLVSWSEQREVKVSSDLAGNTWAPEAFYDERAGEYVVYWASNLYETTDETTRDYRLSYNRMMYATTRDFVTFSEAKPWVDVRRGVGRGMIDATVVEDEGTYYRVIKDEASMTVRQERSTDLRATVTGSLPTTTSTPGWQLVKERVGAGQPNPWGGTFTQGEGPTIFPDNEVEDRWYMFIDQPSYHGGRGYLAFRTDDLAAADWRSVPSASLPSSPRHGTVIPVSQAELDAMRAAYQRDLLITSVEDVTTSTREDAAPTLPATVPATFGNGRTGQVAVEWPAVDPAQYDEPGTFTLVGEVVSGSADDPTATVTVTDATDPAVTVTGAPDGAAGWWVTDPARLAVHATDDTGVAGVESSIDGAPWVRTAGADAVVAVPGDGRHQLRVRARDVTGNTSPATSVPVHVDATAPVSRATYEGRVVTVRSADATSGVHRVQTRVGDGAWTAYTGPVRVGAAGATVSYRAVDAAGNAERVQRVVVPRGSRAPRPVTVLGSVRDATVRYGERVEVAVRVRSEGRAATGKVRLVAGDELLGTARLTSGRATVVLDTAELAGVGRHRVTVRYDGDARHVPDQDVVVLEVRRAVSDTRLSVARTARGPVARVAVTTTPEGLAPDRVRMRLLRRGSLVESAWVVVGDAGRARWALPRLEGRGWTVRATTPDGPVLRGSTAARPVDRP